MEIRRARGQMEREMMVMMKEGGWKITEQSGELFFRVHTISSSGYRDALTWTLTLSIAIISKAPSHRSPTMGM